MSPQLLAWQHRHGITPLAMEELRQMLVRSSNEAIGLAQQPGRSESAIQSMVRLEGAQKGVILWRNNSGALKNPETGGLVRFGLANDSEKVNKVLKSGDLIGIRKVLIEPKHVGMVIGQFVSRECKRGDWKWPITPSEREQAQFNWAALVLSYGGDAAITNTTGSI